MALQTQYSRSRSARNRSTGNQKKGSGTDLHEMSRNKTSVAEFAAEHSLRAKSEVGVEQARREAKGDGRKQAWAPPKRQSLISNSARSQRDPLRTLPPHPSSGASSSGTKSRGAVHLEQLDKLREIFDEATRSGDGKLDEEEFLRACRNVFGEEAMSTTHEEQMRTVFKKIDNLSNDTISWDDFCSFLYLEYHERDSAEARAKKVDFHTPAIITKGSPHHGSVCAVQHTSDGGLVTCSEEGTVCFWSQELELKRTKPLTEVDVKQREKPKWISDMVLSLPHKKIILATGDCELQFFEMVNFEPYCQLSRLESIPLKIVCWHDPEDEVKTVILLGDKDGAVTVMITDNILNAFTDWKSGPKLEGLPTYSLYKLLSNSESGVKCYRWKLHSSWVTELHYFPKLLMFGSCSLDPSASFVLGVLSPSTEVDSYLRQTSSATRGAKRSLLPARRFMSCDQRVFRMAKGVSSADYCSRHNVLVTGSADRFVRVWNPFMTSKPVGTLEGHTAPVFFVKADSANSRLFSIGNDNTIMVWDILEFTCLNSVFPSVHKFSVPTQAAHYNDVGQEVVLATDEVGVIKLVQPVGVRQDMVQTHLSPVAGVAFSPCFNHLITASRDGVVKVWAMETGKKEFEFSVGRCGVSAMAVDKTGKRIVTGSSNGQLKVWSYNSGECLKTLDKENRKEVARARFVSVNQCKYIVAAGWDKKFTIFPDVVDTIQEVYKPMRAGSTTSDYVHETDILALAYGAPHFLATASFCGKIVVWSLISFGVFNELKAEYPTSARHPPSECKSYMLS
ncbi:WD repeat-containing protein on Y chromosome [Geodia barretti]|uniref:WD repeat-containing protein on Y chromosome n=1 Tax=Geodia barretti TaxID=519541 RepID=A0AA35U090_GEOBA|nr:WD repeat-containing protein on Y chromosome [Geodia barretti]